MSINSRAVTARLCSQRHERPGVHSLGTCLKGVIVSECARTTLQRALRKEFGSIAMQTRVVVYKGSLILYVRTAAKKVYGGNLHLLYTGLTDVLAKNNLADKFKLDPTLPSTKVPYLRLVQ